MKNIWILLLVSFYALPAFSAPQDGEEEGAPITHRVIRASGGEACGASLIEKSDGVTKEYMLVLRPSWGKHDRLTLGKKESHVKLGKTKAFDILGFQVVIRNLGCNEVEFIFAKHIKSRCPHKEIVQGRHFVFQDVLY